MEEHKREKAHVTGGLKFCQTNLLRICVCVCKGIVGGGGGSWQEEVWPEIKGCGVQHEVMGCRNPLKALLVLLAAFELGRWSVSVWGRGAHHKDYSCFFTLRGIQG